MHCPLCSRTVTANPKDYIHADGSTTQIKEYTCISCDFTWLPHHEEMKIHKADIVNQNQASNKYADGPLYWHD